MKTSENLKEILEELERDEPTVKTAKLTNIAQPLWTLAGYLHIREALLKHAGLPYNRTILETGQRTSPKEGGDGFPTIDLLQILNTAGVYHQHQDDPRFQVTADNYRFTIISALNPINAWRSGSSSLRYTARCFGNEMPELESLARKAYDFTDKKHNDLWEQVKKVWKYTKRHNTVF